MVTTISIIKTCILCPDDLVENKPSATVNYELDLLYFQREMQEQNFCGAS